MTTGATVFFSFSLGLDFTDGRAVRLLAAFGNFFWEVVEVRLAKGFFVRPLVPADLEVADFAAAGLEALRFGGFEAAALFALGRTDFVWIERPLRAVFGDDGRVAVRDLDRLMPLVTGLLIRRFN